MMTTRDQLIRDGITDAYAEYTGLPWTLADESFFPELVDLIDAVAPSRWNSLHATRLRTFARAYALAEFEYERGTGFDGH